MVALASVAGEMMKHLLAGLTLNASFLERQGGASHKNMIK
jgi:hypothetical protein